MKSLIAIAIGGAVGWFLYGTVVQLLLNPYCDYLTTVPKNARPTTGCHLYFLGAIDGVMIKLKVVLFLGLALSLPYILFQLWAFIVPGLTRRERRMASSVRDPLSIQTIMSSGSSDSEQTALAVSPEGPRSPRLVTTVTPLAKWPIAER